MKIAKLTLTIVLMIHARDMANAMMASIRTIAIVFMDTMDRIVRKRRMLVVIIHVVTVCSSDIGEK